jgi:antitoxin ChpS
MSKAVLRSIGGSVTVAVPKPFLAQAGLGPGSEVRISVRNGSIVLSPAAPRYTLKELMAKGARAPGKPSREERAWQSAAPAGKEVL